MPKNLRTWSQRDGVTALANTNLGQEDSDVLPPDSNQNALSNQNTLGSRPRNSACSRYSTSTTRIGSFSAANGSDATRPATQPNDRNNSPTGSGSSCPGTNSGCRSTAGPTECSSRVGNASPTRTATGSSRPAACPATNHSTADGTWRIHTATLANRTTDHRSATGRFRHPGDHPTATGRVWNASDYRTATR